MVQQWYIFFLNNTSLFLYCINKLNLPIFFKVNYFAWLEDQLAAGNKLSEIDGSNRLEKFRAYVKFDYNTYKLSYQQ